MAYFQGLSQFSVTFLKSSDIEIDKLLYLGMMHRPGLIWLKDEQKEEKRKREYLTLAFRKFVDKIEKENISTYEEYYQNYSIHYLCKQWLDELSVLLRKNGDMDLRREVEKYKKELSKV